MMVDKDEGSPIGQDPMRLCYVCRMPISVLAIRCRYCGAEVGRPRKEQETYTIADLGGEKVGTYTVAGNVTDALESFMMEERAQLEAEERERLEAERRSITGRLRRLVGNAPEEKPAGTNLDLRMGGLDINAINLSASSHHSTTQRKRSSGEGLGKRILIAAIIIALLLGMYFIADAAWTRIRGQQSVANTEGAFVYPNRALEILADGGGLVAAHEEALLALKQENNETNKAIAREVREKIIADVKARAYANPFDMAQLSGASRDITQIGQRDSDTAIIQLMGTINREVGYFAFILTELDVENGTATFRLNNPALTEKEQQVKVGDLLQQRFRVIEITAGGVVLEDTEPEAGGRQLLSKKMVAVQAY
jgi:hypothetical protein